MDDPAQREKAATRSATFLQTIGAVFWSFFGVRKKSDYERDAARLNPVHVIIAGLIGALIFILILILVVKSVVN
jgi:hypothetical protein